MKKTIYFLGVLAFFVALIGLEDSMAKPLSEARKASKGEPSVAQQVGSGDPELDKRLASINETAKGNQQKFVDSISKHFGVAPNQVTPLFEKKMSPADIYMAFLLSKVSKSPIDKVLGSYDANKAKGWGEIAKEMGIKPGSEEFHALKKDNFWAKEANGKKQKEKGHKGKGKGNTTER